MKKGKLFALAVGLFLIAGGAMAVQTSGTSSAKQENTKATSSTIHHEMGTVASVTANELVLDHTWKGKDEKTKFTLDSATKKEGNVAQGDHVTIYYHLENGQRVATELKTSSAKPETKTNKS
jgi:predicted porin